MEQAVRQSLITAPRAGAALVVMRGGPAAAAGDAALVESNFSARGYSGMDVLKKMLAAGCELPIVVTSGGARANAQRCSSPAEIISLVHRPADLLAFCESVRRMPGSADEMYLSVGV